MASFSTSQRRSAAVLHCFSSRSQNSCRRSAKVGKGRRSFPRPLGLHGDCPRINAALDVGQGFAMKLPGLGQPLRLLARVAFGNCRHG